MGKIGTGAGQRDKDWKREQFHVRATSRPRTWFLLACAPPWIGQKESMPPLISLATPDPRLEISDQQEVNLEGFWSSSFYMQAARSYR